MGGEDWPRARLIPTVGIRGQEEQERRATSSLLAVMHAVPEFAHALLGPLGAPKSRPGTYTEVRFKDADGRTCIPDGLVTVERGKKRWTCLLEVKTGSAELESEQVSRYLDIARDNGFDAVLTISNQITSASVTDSPVAVDKRKLRRIALYHLSWLRVVTAAIVQHRFKGVSDPDQAWILGELIAYLDAEPSGASGFDDMGPDWVKVRDAARGDAAPGAGVSVDRRAVGPAGRVCRARSVETTVAVPAPKEGRATARLNWILRQLRDAPDGLRLTVSFEGARETTSGSLAEARENPKLLLSQADARRCPRSFAITLVRPMGKKRGKLRGSFVGDTREQAFDFYRDIVQTLKPWQPRAPKLLPHERDGSEPDDPSRDEVAAASG